MVKSRRVASSALMALAIAAASLGVVQSALASSTSDRPASILVWPKVVADSSGQFNSGVPVDTLIQLSNTSADTQLQAHCFYVNANSHCADNPAHVCASPSDCTSASGTAACVPGWSEIDFNIFITRDQPLAWYASGGMQRGDFPIEGPFHCNAPFQARSCTRDVECGGVGCNVGQSNLGSGIPPVPEDPFAGSLTCIQFDNGNPALPDHTATRNHLTGEAAITELNPTPAGADVQKYNAVGLLATAVAGGAPNELQIGPLGDATAEFEGCPTTLVLNHLFDGATDPVAAGSAAPVTGTVRTDLTLVPCGNNFLTQTPGRSTAQFLVFNEFEQRFSTSRTVDCFFESDLSLIDTRNPGRSIFNAGVAGTIAGQTRIRGVGSEATGNGLLGVARLFVLNTQTSRESGAAYNLHQEGTSPTPDFITIP